MEEQNTSEIKSEPKLNPGQPEIVSETKDETSPEKKPEDVKSDEPVIKEVQPEQPEIIKPKPKDEGFKKFVTVSIIIIIILAVILFFLMRI